MFEYVKLNLERTAQGLLTNKSEFIYADNESPVPANKTYSVYYLLDKSKLYFTNLLTSKYQYKMAEAIVEAVIKYKQKYENGDF